MITSNLVTDTNTTALSKAGVSIWLDDLSRERIVTNNLQALIANKDVVGVTTNPTIFAAALADGEAYHDQLVDLRSKGANTAQAIFEITTTDVRIAAETFTNVFVASNGYDGRVSIEVSPDLANDTEATIAEAKHLWATIDKPNVMIKIPATLPGLPAITAVIAAGISVNVTLIFSLERYTAVIEAYLEGLRQAADAGFDLTMIHSVASFFVSRVDSEVDKRLEAIGTVEATAMRGKAAIANARLAHELFVRGFDAKSAIDLLAKGANRQRPLWASTGMKDPLRPDTAYVIDLVSDGVVNTMPEKTLDAIADHGVIRGDTIVDHYDAARNELARLAAIGIDLDDVTRVLENEGVERFMVSWVELTDTVTRALESV